METTSNNLLASPNNTSSTCILRVALPVPLYRSFDYRLQGDASQLRAGIRVKVPFGSRTLIGFLISVHDMPERSDYVLKDIIAILDDTPIVDAELQPLFQWIADYYHYPYGQVLGTALPTLLCKGKSLLTKPAPCVQQDNTLQSTPLLLNDEQQQAMHVLTQSLQTFTTFILQGVTGSGKTEIYLQTIEKILALNKQVLVLVPEIGLTPQTIDRFTKRFSVPIATFHSKMTDKERLHTWLQAKNTTAKIIIGTRSAVFLPMPALGLIVIDEEHDLSYKQQDRCRYHARDVAIVRAHKRGIPVILGSATPSLETLHNAENGKYKKLILKNKAQTHQKTPIDVIDIRQQPLRAGLSELFIKTMRRHLERGEQVLLFLNRRGYAPISLCHLCGFIEKCSSCDVAMTLHLSPKHLSCHHCGRQRAIQNNCTECKQPTLRTIGVGTEKIEETLKDIFPEYSIARMDKDNMQGKHAFDDMIKDIISGEYHILLGTQMLAKGHHFANLTFVGIIDIDSAFFSSDFRAMEHMGQLITQVSGRAGREDKPGIVMLQTHHPDNPRLQALLHHGYNAFAQELLVERQQLHLPPVTYAALLGAQARSEKNALALLDNAKKYIPSTVNVLGPIMAAHAKRAGYYRAHCFIRSHCRKTLQKALAELPEKLSQINNKYQARWFLDIDPLESF